METIALIGTHPIATIAAGWCTLNGVVVLLAWFKPLPDCRPRAEAGEWLPRGFAEEASEPELNIRSAA